MASNDKNQIIGAINALRNDLALITQRAEARLDGVERRLGAIGLSSGRIYVYGRPQTFHTVTEVHRAVLPTRRRSTHIG